MNSAPRLASISRQRGVTLLGLMFWAIIIASVALVTMKVLPSVNEFYTIQKAVNKLVKEGGTTVPEIRSAFDKQRDIEYSIQSIGGKDLDISKENDKLVIRFAYDKEIQLVEPVYLLIKYSGQSQ
jgi:hypothetical protein